MLVEIVATLAVTGLLMAVALPHLAAGTNRTRMAALVTASASLLREARTTAIASGTPVAASFDPARRKLGTGPESLDIPADVAFSLLAGGNCARTATQVVILFRPDGTNCGGVLRFAKDGHVTRALVNWVDGRIAIVEGD